MTHNPGDLAHLLVDEIFVAVLDVEVSLDFSDLHALFENQSVVGQLLSPPSFSLLQQAHQLAGLFQLNPQLLQLLCHLSISTPSLPRLPYFAPPKADIGIRIISLQIGLKFQRRHQAAVAAV